MASGEPRQRLVRRTLATAAADELRRRILDGELVGGMHLRQNALAAELGISFIPVREALLQLEAEGLVRIVPHRGAVVAELSLTEIGEIFELRATLEPQLLRASAPRLIGADYEAVHALLATYSHALRTNEVDMWGRLNTEFHLRIYARANRSLTLSIVTNLLQSCDRLTRLQLSISRGRGRAEEEHERIVALCEAGRFDEACAVLGQHIDHVARTLLEHVAGRLQGPAER